MISRKIPNTHSEIRLSQSSEENPNKTTILPNATAIAICNFHSNHEKPQIQMPSHKRLCIRVHSPFTNDKNNPINRHVIEKYIPETDKLTATTHQLQHVHSMDDSIDDIRDTHTPARVGKHET